eukprot:169868-Hanusia_phi.AAC.7
MPSRFSTLVKYFRRSSSSGSCKLFRIAKSSSRSDLLHATRETEMGGLSIALDRHVEGLLLEQSD